MSLTVQYPYLESAITGRISMDTATDSEGNQPSSLLDTGSTKSNDDRKELDKLRSVVMDREGLILGIFELLRRVPRCVNCRRTKC